jgi:hypothetical protein
MTHAYQLVIDRVADAVEADYLSPEIGATTSRTLRACAEGLSAATDLSELAVQCTALLHEVSHDLHLRLVHHPGGAPDETDPAGYDTYWADQAKATAGGVRSVVRPDPDVAVVDLGPFLGLPKHTAPWLCAAMTLTAGAGHIVLDLRACHGGTPDAVALLCSYLCGEQPVHLNDVHDRDGVRQFWTLPLVPGPRVPDDTSIAVLVSGETFSGGEELAFILQELSRAQVVGERTRGGAHPRIGVRVHDQLELALPVARPISPRSNTNWEGCGVTPDVPCDSNDALAVAMAVLRGES